MKLFLMIFEFGEHLQLASHIFDLLLDVFLKIGGRWWQTYLSLMFDPDRWAFFLKSPYISY